MKNDTKTSDQKKSTPSALPNDNLDAGFTAIPADRQNDEARIDAAAADGDLVDPIDFGKSDLEDAKISGYTDKNGKAVSMAKKDTTGSPTGAYTDIGVGRSSAVHKVGDKKSETHH
jgi:hypothetical protein